MKKNNHLYKIMKSGFKISDLHEASVVMHKIILGRI
jgi:hypothetical protein